MTPSTAAPGQRHLINDLHHALGIGSAEVTLEAFCRHWLRSHFSRRFTDRQRDLVRAIDLAVRYSGVSVSRRVPRSDGTTTILCAAALWAVLRHRHDRVLFTCSDGGGASSSLMATAFMVLELTRLSERQVVEMRNLATGGGGEILGIKFVPQVRLRATLGSEPWQGAVRGIVIADSIDRLAPIADRVGDLSVIDLHSIDPRDGVNPSPDLSI